MVVVLGIIAIMCLSGLFFACVGKVFIHKQAKNMQGNPHLAQIAEQAKKNTTIGVVVWVVLSTIFVVLWAIVKGVFGASS